METGCEARDWMLYARTLYETASRGSKPMNTLIMVCRSIFVKDSMPGQLIHLIELLEEAA
jgi:hypothetical protein